MRFLLGWRHGKRDRKPKCGASGAAVPTTDLDDVHGKFATLLDEEQVSQELRSKLEDIPLEVKHALVTSHRPATLTTAVVAGADGASGYHHKGRRRHRSSITLHKRQTSLDFSFLPSSIKKTYASSTRHSAHLSSKTAAGRQRRPSVGGRLLSVDDFLHYLGTTPVEEYDVSALRKLNLILRNEAADWLSQFLERGGVDRHLMPGIVRLCNRPTRLDEEMQRIFDDLLSCMLSLCTTRQGLYAVSKITDLPAVLCKYLLSKRAPIDFEPCTRMVLLIEHWIVGLVTPTLPPRHLDDDPSTAASPVAVDPTVSDRARQVLTLLRDDADPSTSTPASRTHDFLPPPRDSAARRPFRRLVEEMDSPCFRACWMFVFGENTIALLPLSTVLGDGELTRQCRAAVSDCTTSPAAYVGSVEWLASEYLCAHLSLLDAILASLPTATERNVVRADLRDSNFERLIHRFVRKADKALNRRLHLLLSVWATRATADGWDVTRVLTPSRHGHQRHRRSSIAKSVDAEDDPTKPVLPALVF